MAFLDSQLAVHALQALGDALPNRDSTPNRLVLIGGVAGLLGGLLDPSRTTADCDVLWEGSSDDWPALELAAAKVAAQLKLPEHGAFRLDGIPAASISRHSDRPMSFGSPSSTSSAPRS